MQTGSEVGLTARKALCLRLMLRKLCLWADLPNRISLLELLIMVCPSRLRQQQSRGQMTSASRRNRGQRRKRTSSPDSRIPFVIFQSFRSAVLTTLCSWLTRLLVVSVLVQVCHVLSTSALSLTLFSSNKVLLLVEALSVLFSEHTRFFSPVNSLL